MSETYDHVSTAFPADTAYQLNMSQLLIGDPIRLRYVWRYSTCRVNHRESVAEHSFFVTLYAGLIAQWLQRNPVEMMDSAGNVQRFQHRVNWERLMLRAALHDVEEARTGDMPRFFKHGDEQLRQHLEQAATLAFDKVVSGLVDDHWALRLNAHWQLAKDDTLEGRIVAFADFLSVLAFVIQEIKSGNADAVEHIEQLEAYAARFAGEAFEYFRPLYHQVQQVMKEFFHGET